MKTLRIPVLAKRLIAWGLVPFFSLVATLVVVLLAAVLVSAFFRNREQQFYVSVAFMVGIVVFPGFFATGLILADRSLMVGASWRLASHSVLWGILPALLMFGGAIGGLVPFYSPLDAISFLDFGPSGFFKYYWPYMALPILAAIIGGFRFHPKVEGA